MYNIETIICYYKNHISIRIFQKFIYHFSLQAFTFINRKLIALT